jgi:hypothetical protein
MSDSLDMSEFDATLARYIAAVPHALQDILNKKMLYIAAGAYRKTVKAERATIERDLQVVAYKLSKSRKTGQFKRGKSVSGGPRVAYIINALRRKKGLPGLEGKEMAKEVSRFTGKRLRAIGSLKAGWVGILKKLAAVAHGQSFIEPGPRVKQVGVARPAKDGWDPIVEIEYGVTEKRKSEKLIDPRVVKALGDAFADESRSMEDYMTEQLQKQANTSGMNG